MGQADFCRSKLISPEGYFQAMALKNIIDIVLQEPVLIFSSQHKNADVDFTVPVICELVGVVDEAGARNPVQ